MAKQDPMELLNEKMDKLIETLSGGDEKKSSRGKSKAEILREEIESTREFITLLERQQKTEKSLSERIAISNQLSEQRRILKEKELALRKKDLDMMPLTNDAERKAYLQALRKYEQDKKSYDLQEKSIVRTIQSTKEFLNLGKAFEIIHNPFAVVIDQMTSLNKIYKDLSQSGALLEDHFSHFTDIFESTSKPLGIFVGQARDADGGIVALTRYGIGAEQLMESFNGLRDSMVSFSDQSVQTQNYLAGTAAKMKNLGVSIEEQGRAFNFFVKSLRMTGVEAGLAMERITKAALGAGISAKKAMQDFASAAPQLAAQGKQMEGIFIDLQREAKALGVEVSDLLQIFGSAMDTFEGSAQAAGKFNAVMGGDYLNSMQLLNATESQRVEMVKKAMDQTGKSFDTMSKYEQIAVANTLGIKDLSKAQAILGTSTAEMERKRQEEAMTQDKLNKLQAQAVDLGMKLGSVFQVIYGVAKPFLDIIASVADWLMILNDKTYGIPGIIVVGLLFATVLQKLFISLDLFKFKLAETNSTGLGGMMKAMWGTIKAGAKWVWSKTVEIFTLKRYRDALNEAAIAKGGLDTAMGAKLTAGSWIAGILSLLPLLMMLYHAVHDFGIRRSPAPTEILIILLPQGINATGTAAQNNAHKIMAFGVAALGIGAGIFLAAYGIAQLVKSFKGLSGPQILAATFALVAFGIAVGVMMVKIAAFAMGPGLIAIPAIEAIGLAFLVIGAGIGLAAFGMSLFVKSVVELAKESNAVPTILALGAGIYMISSGIGLLSVTLTGFLVMGLAVAAGVFLIKKAIASLGEAFEKFPTEKSITFKASMSSLTDMIEAAKTLKSEDLNPTIELIGHAKQYLELSNSSKGDDPAVKLLQKIIELITTASTAKKDSATAGKVAYTLEFDGKQFGKLIEKYAPDSMDTKTAKFMINN